MGSAGVGSWVTRPTGNGARGVGGGTFAFGATFVAHLGAVPATFATDFGAAPATLFTMDESGKACCTRTGQIV